MTTEPGEGLSDATLRAWRLHYEAQAQPGVVSDGTASIVLPLLDEIDRLKGECAECATLAENARLRTALQRAQTSLWKIEEASRLGYAAVCAEVAAAALKGEG